MVNFGKSFIVPINVEGGKTKILAGTLGCQVATMPFTYLGFAFGYNKACHPGIHTIIIKS
jgi:hypothetical protein